MSNVPQIPNDIASIFLAANNQFSSLQADTGEGFQGEWPTEGDHPAYVLSMAMTTGTFKQTDGAEFPCAEISFAYKLIPNTNSPDYKPNVETLEFKGSRMQIVNEAILTDPKAKMRAQIDKKRFKGFLLKILGQAPADILSGAQQCHAKVSGDTKVALMLHIEYRAGRDVQQADGSIRKGGVFKTDYAKDLISG